MLGLSQVWFLPLMGDGPIGGEGTAIGRELGVGEDGTGERWQEGVECEDGGGDASKGVRDMVMSIDLETQFCLVVRSSVLES